MPLHLQYPFPWKIGLLLLWDALLLRQRDFQNDSSKIIQLLNPPPKIFGIEYIPTSGPALLATNHYSRPGFPAWWIALSISAAVPLEIHWVMTAGWTHLAGLESLPRWLFPHVARVYGFTTTPPMPPDPRDAEMRAQAVRRVLRVARAPGAVIGLAPEDRDHPGGVLAPPPPGAGRFIGKLVSHCQRIVPIGVYEGEECLCVNFGPPFQLDIPQGILAAQRDQIISKQVMRSIAQQLPPALRGEYGQAAS